MCAYYNLSKRDFNEKKYIYTFVYHLEKKDGKEEEQQQQRGKGSSVG